MPALKLFEGAVPCVQCGFCCKIRTCGYGEWDAAKKQCSELVDNGDGTYGCRKYEKIINSNETGWHIAPAFGAGCCMSMCNEARAAVIRRRAGTHT